MTTLVVVESSAKAKTIQKYLGDGYFVWACGGHIRHMTDKSLGFNSSTYAIDYELDEAKKPTLAKLSQDIHNGRFNHVILATDPDREGEAIAQSLYEVLGLNPNNYQRSKFNEITKTAIERAVSENGKNEKIDANLVKAQESRRILDRAVGWFASGVVSKTLADRMPIGRVQSPAVRFVVDRQEAIDNFQPTEYNDIELTVEDVHGNQVQLKLDAKASKIDLQDDKYWVDSTKVMGVIEYLNTYEPPLHCRDVRMEDCELNPPKPLTTLDMQAIAIKTLGLSGKEIDKLAQELYQAGIITYPRTDSPRMSADGFNALRNHSMGANLPIVDNPYEYAAKDSAQDAHECIRPTDFDDEALARAGLSEKHRALYQLIKKRALMSQMPPKLYTNTQAMFDVDIDGQTYCFKASHNKTTSEGFSRYKSQYAVTDEDDEDSSDVGKVDLSGLSVGDTLKLVKVDRQVKKTRAPSQFTQSSLIKELDRQGIGRPSTFSSIFERIKDHGYIDIKDKKTVPTDLAKKMVAGTKNVFQIMDAKYTEKMEAQLDKIANGDAAKDEILSDFIHALQQDLAKFENKAFEASRTEFNCSCSDTAPLYKVNRTSKEGKPYTMFVCHSCDKRYFERDGKPHNPDEHIENLIKQAKLEPNPLTCPCCNSVMVKQPVGKYTLARCYTCGFRSFVNNKEGVETLNWEYHEEYLLLKDESAKFGYVPKAPCSCGAALKLYKKYKGTADEVTVVECTGHLAKDPKRFCKSKLPSVEQVRKMLFPS